MRFHLFFALASILHLPWSFVHQDLMDSTDPESWLLPSAPLLPNLLLHISLATYKRASRPVHPGTAFNAHTHTRGHQIRNWIYPAGGKCKKSIETLPPHFFFSSSNQMTGHLIFRPQSGRQRVQSSTASLGSIDHQTFEYESQSRSAARKKKKKKETFRWFAISWNSNVADTFKLNGESSNINHISCSSLRAAVNWLWPRHSFISDPVSAAFASSRGNYFIIVSHTCVSRLYDVCSRNLLDGSSLSRSVTFTRRSL